MQMWATRKRLWLSGLTITMVALLALAAVLRTTQQSGPDGAPARDLGPQPKMLTAKAFLTLPLPDGTPQPKMVDVARSPSYVRVMALFGSPPSAADGEAYTVEAIRALRAQRRAYVRANIRDYGGFFVKGWVQVFSDPQVYQIAHSPDAGALALALRWTNLHAPDADDSAYESSNMAGWLPQGRDLQDRLEAASETTMSALSFAAVTPEEGVFRAISTLRAADVDEAQRLAVTTLGADGMSPQMMRVVQLLPELVVLQLEIPVEEEEPLRVEADRDELFELHRMGERYMERTFEYEDRADKPLLEHLEGKLTRREAERAEARVREEEDRYYHDLWLECCDMLERW
ncbi:MAG: hypothetical protein R6V05_02855 [Candidatus Brocadiia bacterium]